MSLERFVTYVPGTYRLQSRDRKGAVAEKRETLQSNPFDPRTEVSADAKHVADKIVRHLWTIFVFLPVVSIILYEMAR